MRPHAIRDFVGIVLHSVATAIYIFAITHAIMIILEVWKGFTILPYLKNYWLSFGGAREVVSAVRSSGVGRSRLMCASACRCPPWRP